MWVARPLVPSPPPVQSDSGPRNIHAWGSAELHAWEVVRPRREGPPRHEAGRPPPGAYPDVVEGVGLVVCIIDEAVSPVVPLRQRDPQPGVDVLQKLAAVLDGLQGRRHVSGAGFGVRRQHPPTARGSTVSASPPLRAGQSGAVPSPRTSSRPHGTLGPRHVASQGHLPWEGAPITSLPTSPPYVQFGVQTPHRGTALWDTLLHAAPGQPLPDANVGQTGLQLRHKVGFWGRTLAEEGPLIPPSRPPLAASWGLWSTGGTLGYPS